MDRESLVILKALMEEAETGSRVGSWTWNLKTHELTWSDHMCRMMGLDPAATEPGVKLLYSLVHPDDLDYVKELHQGILDGVMPEHARYRIKRADGSVRTWMATGRQVTNEDGTVTHAVGVVVDLSERIELERSVDRINETLDDAQELADLGVFSVDPATGFATWSKQIYRICGLPFTTRPHADTFTELLHPHDREAVLKAQTEVIETGEPRHIEARIIRPDGTTRYVELRARRRSGGETTLLAGVLHDVTIRRELEEKVRWSAALESTGRLAAGVAHDFNNLLTVIVTNAQELRANRDVGAADDILSAAEAGADLVRRLLAFGKAGPTKRSPMDLAAQLREAVSWIDKVTGDDITVSAELPDQPVFVNAAPAEVHQLLLNLTTNAKDAMPTGGSLVLSLSTPEAAAPAPVILTVADTGRGMDAETKARAFDAFFTTKPTHGRSSGLGLSMVYGVVSELGGNIALSSTLEEGTVVHLTLPTAEAPGQKPEAAPPEVVHDPGDAATILVVEDESAVLRAALRILERDGHRVIGADRPQVAIDHLRETSVDLVLTDLSMPQGGGRRVADEAQKLQPEAPIVFMTGYALGENKLPGEILAKPFSPDQLKSIVRQVLAR